MASLRLKNKTAIVTGGSSGFGAAIAHRFAEEGAAVIIADINTSGAQQVISEFEQKFGANSSRVSRLPGNQTEGDSDVPPVAGEAVKRQRTNQGEGEGEGSVPRGSIKFVKADVTSERDWAHLIAEALSSWDGVDILVNNAGTTYRNKPTLEVTEDEFDKVFNVNVKSIFRSIGAFIPQALERGKGGSIINIASIGATRPRPGLVWYNASKGAVWNATKGLAAEYGSHQVRVNAICPLLSGTGLFESFVGVPDTPQNRQKFLFNVPMGRICDSKDVADACLFYASDESSFVTGTCLEVDGGRGI